MNKILPRDNTPNSSKMAQSSRAFLELLQPKSVFWMKLVERHRTGTHAETPLVASGSIRCSYSRTVKSQEGVMGFNF